MYVSVYICFMFLYMIVHMNVSLPIYLCVRMAQWLWMYSYLKLHFTTEQAEGVIYETAIGAVLTFQNDGNLSPSIILSSDSLHEKRKQEV